jgi:hypothetical protein
MKKTQEQILSEINAYITKTSQHLFSVNDRLVTYVPFQDGSQLGYATIIVGKDVLSITARQMVTEASYNFYGNNYPNVVKNNCFAPHQKATSIPYFKKMRNLIEAIKPHLTLDNTKNKELADKHLPLIAELVSN